MRGLPVSLLAFLLVTASLASGVLSYVVYTPGPNPHETAPIPSYEGPARRIVNTLENTTYSSGHVKVEGKPRVCSIDDCSAPCIGDTIVLPAPGMWRSETGDMIPAWRIRSLAINADRLEVEGRRAVWNLDDERVTVIVAEHMNITLPGGEHMSLSHAWGGEHVMPCMHHEDMMRRHHGYYNDDDSDDGWDDWDEGRDR